MMRRNAVHIAEQISKIDTATTTVTNGSRNEHSNAMTSE